MNQPQPPVPNSPVYVQVNFVGQQQESTVSAGVTNEMLLLGISSLVAQLVVRTNAAAGNIIPPQHLLNGMLQKIAEISPAMMQTVRQMDPPKG